VKINFQYEDVPHSMTILGKVKDGQIVPIQDSDQYLNITSEVQIAFSSLSKERSETNKLRKSRKTIIRSIS